MQEARVRSLLRELRSHMRGMAEKKKCAKCFIDIVSFNPYIYEQGISPILWIKNLRLIDTVILNLTAH